MRSVLILSESCATPNPEDQALTTLTPLTAFPPRHYNSGSLNDFRRERAPSRAD